MFELVVESKMAAAGGNELDEHNITLNRGKCNLGAPQVKWFGMIYSKQGMSKDPEKWNKSQNGNLQRIKRE